MAGLWSRVGGWVAGAGAVLGVVGAAWWRGRAAGTASARARAVEADLRSRETRDAVERDVAREPDPAGRLRERWSRD
jgi:hypothetical protein